MITRVHFRDEGMKVIADNCKGIFNITQAETGGLYLWVQMNNITLNFLIEYSEELASAIGRTIEYNNGLVLFTDYTYTIPMNEDIEECPVCYEMYEPMYGSTCGHHCCVDCMKNMADNGLYKCPMCRSDSFMFPIKMAIRI